MAAIRYMFDIVYVMDNCKLCAFVMHHYHIEAEFIYIFNSNQLNYSPGARFTKQTYNNFYPKFLVKQSYNVF